MERPEIDLVRGGHRQSPGPWAESSLSSAALCISGTENGEERRNGEGRSCCLTAEGAVEANRV